jgi:hypothetical protein
VLPKLTGHVSVTEGWVRFGYPLDFGFWIGVLETCAQMIAFEPRGLILRAQGLILRAVKA